MRSMALLLATFFFASAVQAIVGGREAQEGEAPGALALYSVSQEQEDFFCSATLLAPDVMVTAAHCFNEQSSNSLQIRYNSSATNVKIQARSVDLDGRDIVHITFSPPIEDHPPAQMGDVSDGELWISGYGCLDSFSGPNGEHLHVGNILFAEIQSDHITFPSNPESGFFPSLCHGDSGGGVYAVNSSGEWLLVAVNSGLMSSADVGRSRSYLLSSCPVCP